MFRFLYMKIICFGICLLLFKNSNSQLLSWSPDFLQETSSSVQITLDASKGNQGLFNYSNTTDVYVHIGCITNLSTSSSDWKYVKFTWGTTNAAAQAANIGSNLWRYTITGGLRNFFGITNAAEKIQKISILFRNGSGDRVQRNTGGADMYIPVYESALAVRIDNPVSQPLFIPQLEQVYRNLNDAITINAKANQSSNLRLLVNGNQIATASNATTISSPYTLATTGRHIVVVEATVGANTVRDTAKLFIYPSINTAALPAGVKDGINYNSNTSVTLVLFAPNKTRASVIGETNDWFESVDHQMNRTPDGNRYWVTLNGLTPGAEYAYQYIVDGTIKIADPFAEKVLDPWNDGFIPATSFPSLKPYPVGKTTDIVSVFQTAKPAYTWQVPSFTKPDKRNLVMYELLVRDFLAAQNWRTLRDTISYIKRLGVNAIHVMPFNEFEGNNSWGYNPSFYFAPDKYYGTETALREFVDECHKQGIAVIMDMVLNHSFGQSPMVRLYWDAVNNKPATNSPWFNPDARHPFNVGYDFNHESQATKDFVDRVIEHWLVNYKIDGFRWDLSKGFTQTNNPNDINAWSNRDNSRIAIWKRIYDKMQAIAPSSYCVLEHFAANSEEVELADYGMLLWGNLNYNFSQAVMGNVSNSNFQSGIHVNRGWSNPHLITYMESHDEERVMVNSLTNGNSSNPSHNPRDLNTALKRSEMAAAFWAMMPGPKLLWQFGELGFDMSINRCENGSISNDCRTAPKPPVWNYRTNPNRQSLYTVYSELLRLKTFPDYSSTFTSSDIAWSTSGAVKWMRITGPNLTVVVYGNFDVNAASGSLTFPIAGTWYNYLTGTTRTATGSLETLNLQPGEYAVFTSRDVRGTVLTAANPFINNNVLNMFMQVNPNPVKTNSIISYELPANGNVTISINDMQGKRLANLFQGYQLKGKYNRNLNTSDFNISKILNGIYIVQVSLNGKTRTEKIIKL